MEDILTRKLNKIYSDAYRKLFKIDSQSVQNDKSTVNFPCSICRENFNHLVGFFYTRAALHLDIPLFTIYWSCAKNKGFYISLYYLF